MDSTSVYAKKMEPHIDRVAGMPCLRLSLHDSQGRARLTPERIAHLTRILSDLCQNQAGAKGRPPLVLIQGKSGSFCEGMDLETLSSPHEYAGTVLFQRTPTAEQGATHRRAGVSDDDTIAAFGRLLELLSHTPGPVIALVDGPALGGGVGLAAAADLVLASPQASFALPEVLMGVIPAMVFPVLARRIGMPKARLMALGAQPLSASLAFQLGLADEITDDLDGALKRYARRFARMDPRAVGAMKSLIASHFGAPVSYSSDAADRFWACWQSQEAQTRLARFAAGETPWPEESPW